MGKKKDSSSMIVLAVVVIAAYLLLTGKFAIPGLAPSGGQPISASGGGAPGVGVECYKVTGKTPQGTDIVQKVQCGSPLESVFGGVEGIMYYSLVVTTTADPSTSFDFFRFDNAEVRDAAGASAGTLATVMKNGGATFNPQSGPIPAGGSWTINSKHVIGTTQATCTPAIDGVNCDNVAPITVPADEKTVWTGTECVCVLKLVNIQAASDPTKFEAVIFASRTPQGGGPAINTTATSLSPGYTITPDPTGTFAVNVQITTS